MGLIGNIVKRARALVSVAPRAPTMLDFIDSTVMAADLTRRFGPLPKAVQLLKYFLACTEANTCAVLKANYLAQFAPKMYRSGKAGQPGGFNIKQRRVLDKRVLKHLKDANPQRGVGTVARYAGAAGKEIYEVLDHPFLTLSAQPNPYESAFLFWQMDHLQRQIFGNAYSVSFFGDDGLPEQLRHMAAQHVRIVPDKEHLIHSFEYKVGPNQPDNYDPECIAHFKAMTSVVDYFYGQSWMERCIPDMDLLISAKEVEKHRFNNGLRVEFAVLMPEYNPVQKEAVREEIDRKGVGVRRSGGYLIMPGASTVVPLTMNNRDMQYSEGMARATKTIRFCAGVPEAFGEINSSNLAGGLLADGLFKQLTIQPELGNDAQQRTNLLNRWYGHEEGEIWMAYPDIVDLGAEENAKTTLAAWQANLLTLDEARADIDRDPINDERGGMVFAELSASTQVAPGAQMDTLNAPISRLGRARDEAGVERPKAEDNQYNTDKAREVVVELELPASPKRKALPAPAAKIVSVADLWRARITKAGGEWAYPFGQKAYRDVLGGVQSWYEAGVEAGHFDPKSLEAALQPLASIFQEGGQDGIALVIAQPGGEQRIADTGVSFDVLTPEVEHYFTTRTIRLAHEVAANKNAALADAVRESIKQGMNTQEATKAVQAVMQDASKFEAERIARDQSSRAYNQGSLKSWEEARVTRKAIRQAGGACELCNIITQKFVRPVPLAHVYFKQGDTLTAGSTTYSFDYESLDSPPWHPSCRCSMVPVIE